MSRIKDWFLRENRQMAINYLLMRRLIGLIAFSFPFILAFGFFQIESSISVYYYTYMRDVFVGVLCAVSLFLFSYRGYARIDTIAAITGSVFALGVALSPCTPDGGSNSVHGTLHLVFAGLFFTDLIFFCYLFTKSDKPKGLRTKSKNRRNIWYTACAIVMGVCIICIPFADNSPQLVKYHPVFWLESIALCAFGISWIIKGRTFSKINVKQYAAQRSYIPINSTTTADGQFNPGI